MKVLSFTELRTYSTLKTVAVMDELENVVTLNESDARRLRSKDYREGDNVVIAGGQKGVLRGYYFSIAGIKKDTFELNTLFSIPLSPSSEQENELTRIVRLSYIDTQSLVIVANADHVIHFYDM